MKTNFLLHSINMIVLAVIPHDLGRELKTKELLVNSAKSLIDQLTAAQLVKLHNEYSERPIGKTTQKGVSAPKVWELLNSDAVLNVRRTKDKNPHKPLKMDGAVMSKPHRKGNKQYKLMDHFIKNAGKNLSLQNLQTASKLSEKSVPVRISVLNNHHNMNIIKNRDNSTWCYSPI